MNGAEIADGRRGTKGNLMQVLLAKHDSSRSLQSSYDFSIRGGKAVFKDRAGERGPDTRHVDVVLESDRNTVEWSAPLATSHFSFGFTRLPHCLLGGHRDEGVEVWV